MDKKLKAKWVKALRSGKFKQGREMLRDGKGDNAMYCCLGVLGEIAKVPYTGSHSYLVTRAGIHRLLPASTQQQLAEMNDKGQRFPTIAKWIEKHL